jgi:hypothetical protein
MAENGTSEETSAPAAESPTEPSEAEAPTAQAEHEAPTESTSRGALADDAPPTSPAEETAVAGDAKRPPDSSAPAAESKTEPSDREAATAHAEREAVEEPTVSVPSTDEAPPTSPAGERAVPEAADHPHDSSPSIEVHGEVDGETGLTEPPPVATVAPTPVVTERDATRPAVSRAESRAAARGGMSRFERGVVVTVLLGIALAAVVALALPRKALLVVSALGPSDRSLQNLKIMIDGDLRCERSPCSVGDLAAGEHTVRVFCDEFGVAERVVPMRTGADHSVAFVLERPQREVATSLSAPSAPAEPSALVPLPVTAAARATKPRGPATGTIKANSIPVSDVLVDGQIQGKTPANISTAPGLHTVVFVHPDYGRREVVVQVKPNQDAVAAVRFRRSTP